MTLPALALVLLAPLGRCAPSTAAVATGTLYPERSTAPIVVVSPPEGLNMPLAEGEFILGSVRGSSTPFSINGKSVSVYPNGAFLAWVPISPGTFTFHCDLSQQGQATSSTRTIFVTPPPMPLTELPGWPVPGK